MMGYSTLTFDLWDNVATISLNRQEAANAINFEMANELMHVAMNVVNYRKCEL